MRELAHIGYVVTDMDRAVRRFEAEGSVVVIPPTDDPIQRVSCCLVRSDDAIDIELVAPLMRGDSPIEARLKRGGGLDHVCYFVDDLDESLASEIELGAVMVCAPTYAVTFGRDIAFVHRRSGLVIELMAKTPRRP